MRLFIGIDLPPRVKQSLSKSQLELKKLGVQGSWKERNDFHITLEFLGELAPESVTALIQIIKTVIRDKKKFKLQIDKLGAFPSFHRAHTLWAGIDGSLVTMEEIRKELQEELRGNGFLLQDAPFKPHITLLSRPKTLVPDMASFSIRRRVNFTVSEIILFESKIEDGKRIYPRIFRGELKANRDFENTDLTIA